ncbi:hypothetical protein A2U01_0049509, partial [Trifolium medium]|nr:hypothetical protein [Trifolium medium]
NPNTATVTETFDSSESNAATEPESEESVEKTVSLGDEDTESEKTVTGDQGAIDLDEVESMDELPPSSAQKGIVNSLRSRKGKNASTTVVTPAVTKKVKDPALKPVRYGPGKTCSKGTSPSEKKKKPLKRKSAPSSESDCDV